jgi:hypothetical protein
MGDALLDGSARDRGKHSCCWLTIGSCEVQRLMETNDWAGWIWIERGLRCRRDGGAMARMRVG